jgi:hypothetical protein
MNNNKTLISLLIFSLMYIIGTFFYLQEKNKKIAKLQAEKTLNEGKLNSIEKQLNTATEQFILLMDQHEQEIKVYKHFQDSCLTLIQSKKTLTETKIRGLINLSNEELRKIATE